MSINRVVLSGNLTREPDFRLTAGGTPAMGHHPDGPAAPVPAPAVDVYDRDITF